MTVLAIFQNQWARDPASLQRIMDKHKDDPARSAELAKRVMAVGRGKTWQQLKKHFGDELLKHMTFGEASPIVGATSGSVFAADHAHLRRIVRHFKPTAIICFGNVAKTAVASVVCELGEAAAAADDDFSPALIQCCHPCARGRDVDAQLTMAASLLHAHLDCLGAR